MRPRIPSLLVLLPLTLVALAASAPPGQAQDIEPHVFGIPPAPEDGGTPWTFEIVPEYRTRFIRVDPLDVNGTVAQDVSWAEQRLRLDMTFARAGLGAVYVQADVLDGVLYGDNGEFGSAPEVNSGMGIATKQANNAGWRVGLLSGGDPLELDSYGPQLTPIEPLQINFAYGEVLLPFGLLRVGRQPLSDAGWIGGNDGRTGRNRWGASWYHSSVDRVAFGTKLSEIWRMAEMGEDYVPDKRMDHGLVLGLAYDFLVEDDITRTDDDLRQVAAQLSWLHTEGARTGDFTDIDLTAILTYRWDDRFDTGILALPMRAGFTWRNLLRLYADAIVIRGSTRELSAGLAELSGTEVQLQDMEAMGARVIMDWLVGDFTFTGMWAYASGDDDPRPGDTITSYSWPRDTNLGLLMFEHTLAFQSARSAAVGIENLRQLESESFPITEIATDGRVTNVNALFPQVFWTPVEGLKLKAGALFAWSDVPVTDPIQSVLAWDGEEIRDDAMNYHGGEPGNYWGTEIDFGVEYAYRDLFWAVAEAGVLFPGEGLEDENGDAVTSWMLETRFTFRL
ncbi:MAG: hypothetical protein ACQEXJ_02275 [Myxococcota bacterium]